MANKLVVEDDREINNLLCEALKNEMYNTVQAYDGKEALFKYDKNINLVILDLMIPYVDGIEVLRQIREKSKIPVIILSAKDDECDRIVGLSMGADDYMVKPFSIKELIARVKAQLRRYTDYNNTSDNNEDVFIHGDLKVDSIISVSIVKNIISILKIVFLIVKGGIKNGNKTSNRISNDNINDFNRKYGRC